MDLIDKYLGEARGPDAASAIREILKKRFKLTSRDVSVRSSRGGGIDIHAKTVKALPYLNQIENIGKDHESISRDDYGNILRGGNFFVFTNIDWKFSNKLEKQIESELNKVITDDWKNDVGTNVVTLWGTYEVVKEPGKQEYRVIDPKESMYAGPSSRLTEIPSRILRLMIKNVDKKNLKKLK